VKVYVSAAISIDGYLDDTSPERLILSNERDLADVHVLRSRCDAILVGANTIRRDNPTLGVRSELLAKFGRVDSARAPVKVTVTESGNLDPSANFFSEGDVDKLVICPALAHARLEKLFPDRSDVRLIPLSAETLDATSIIQALRQEGINSLLIEGGSTMLSQAFFEGQVDELRLAVAPVFVADPGAPRLLDPTAIPTQQTGSGKIHCVKKLDDGIAVIHILMKRTDEPFLCPEQD